MSRVYIPRYRYRWMRGYFRVNSKPARGLIKNLWGPRLSRPA